MAKNSTVTFPDISNIKIAYIFGLWEVLRVSRKNEIKPSYPWLKGRFKFNFVDDMIFECINDG